VKETTNYANYTNKNYINKWVNMHEIAEENILIIYDKISILKEN
jgi:hypothetical protein